MPKNADTQTNTLGTNEALKLEAQRFVDSIKDEEFGVLGLLGTQFGREKIVEYLTNDDIGDTLKGGLLFKGLGGLTGLPLGDKVISKKREMMEHKYPLLKSLCESTGNQTNQLEDQVITTSSIQQQMDILHNEVSSHNSGQISAPLSENSSGSSGNDFNLSENQILDSSHWTEIPRERVQKTRDYIVNGGDFYSPSKGRCTRGESQYKGVCTTGAWNVLHHLTGLPLPNNLEIDGTDERSGEMGQRLNAMNCYKILDSVDPTNPSVSGYVPKDGDVAVRPRFQSDHGQTQHMACYINGHWVSDTIQNRMSCYNATPQKERNPYEPNVKIYRYNPNINNIHYS